MNLAMVYEEARRVAQAGDVAARAALAQRPGTAPEILYYLTADGAVAVRQAVAANPATPAQADRLLSTDIDPSVRAVLGRKLASLSPNLSPEAQDRLQRLGWETLSLLVADTASQVRAAIAEVLADMPDAPRALILRLARDIAMPVAEPVIRLSPLLSEADLLALVSAPPVPDTVTAVARRPALSEALCDAILERAEPGMVTVLLANPSAAIRESTLDGLIASAAEHTEWHEPLVQRPRLSAGAVRTLGEIVAAELLRLLAARADLSPELTVELQARLAARLAEAEPALTPEEAFAAAARAGDRDAMVRLLAEAARLPPAAVLHAVSLRNAKALCSLCWQAGYSTTSLATVQLVLGQLPPAQALAAAPGPSWPLGPDEMQWQLELLGSL